MAMASAVKSNAAPPYFSGMVIESIPSSDIFLMASCGNSPFSSISAAFGSSSLVANSFACCEPSLGHS